MALKNLPAPMTVEQQLNNLKELNLTIEDETYARQFLNDVSYFRFIKAYSLGLKPKNGIYFESVSFNQLVELYLFNANFRHLLFPQIEKIEVTLRSRLANYFSVTYGVLGYQDGNNFSSTKYHAAFLRDIQDEINRNKRAPFIKNFQNNYENGSIPFYALVEIFSFGTLSKFFKNMKGFDKKKIASTYHVNYGYFESWIESISYVRNLCAHYGRLYNAKLTKTPHLYSHDFQKGISNNRIFSTILCMKYLLPNNNQWQDFLDSLSFLFEKHPHADKKNMGFPEDWKTLLLQ